MKILQIVNPVISFPPVTIGGTERIVKYLVDELASRGHELTVLCHDDSYFGPNVKTVYIGTYLDQKNTIAKVWKHLLTNKYDVIHNHGRLLYFLPVMWSKVRKVHTFHMANLNQKLLNKFILLKPRNFTFTPCGQWIQQKYQHIKANWNYVHNGLPSHLYSFNKINNINVDLPLVIICRITPSKGILQAINIAIESGRRLIIAGKIGDFQHEKEWFSQNIESQFHSKKISFIGEVNDAEKCDLLNNAAALILPTLESEAFNTTMIEANACGCPVLSYDKYCFSEFIINGVNGFKGDDDELVKSANRLNELKRDDCRKIFEENYTSAIMTDNYLELYNTTV